MHAFAGAGGPQQHRTAFRADTDHPAVLCGNDVGPTPVEWVLHALASCLTAGTVNVAAARGVTLHEVTCTVIGDIDLQGILGLSKQVRNGFQAVRANFSVSADAPAEKVAEIVRQVQARSAVFDILTNSVPKDARSAPPLPLPFAEVPSANPMTQVKHTRERTLSCGRNTGCRG